MPTLLAEATTTLLVEPSTTLLMIDSVPSSITIQQPVVQALHLQQVTREVTLIDVGQRGPQGIQGPPGPQGDPGSGGGVAFVWQSEDLSSLLNGADTSFALAGTPIAGATFVYVDGVLQFEGSLADYTVSGSTLTLGFVLGAGRSLRVRYMEAA